MQQKENTKIIIKGKVEEIIKNIKSRQIELGCDHKLSPTPFQKWAIRSKQLPHHGTKGPASLPYSHPIFILIGETIDQI